MGVEKMGVYLFIYFGVSFPKDMGKETIWLIIIEL